MDRNRPLQFQRRDRGWRESACHTHCGQRGQSLRHDCKRRSYRQNVQNRLRHRVQADTRIGSLAGERAPSLHRRRRRGRSLRGRRDGFRRESLWRHARRGRGGWGRGVQAHAGLRWLGAECALQFPGTARRIGALSDSGFGCRRQFIRHHQRGRRAQPRNRLHARAAIGRHLDRACAAHLRRRRRRRQSTCWSDLGPARQLVRDHQLRRYVKLRDCLQASAQSGGWRATVRGPVKVPGLGDPNVRESNSVSVVDVSTPATPKLETFIRTGLPFGPTVNGGSSPSGILAAAGRVFVSNANDDTITVIDAKPEAVESEIPIRIPGLERYRGVLPIGLAYHEKSGLLLVAEAGINAVGVIDVNQRRVLGHIPAAWFPTRVVMSQDTVYVANARGFGQGPNAFRGSERHGSLSMFPLPKAGELAASTRFVMEANGFRPRPQPERELPTGIQHVVLIVKENRTYDEVFGDIPGAMGMPEIARLGTRGYVDGKQGRFSIRDVNVTPNHHAM